ncbi:hypothetical protein EYF80_055105 [Liparis tanakae]|uniref:Uncharacterized protein n=1 Tax=Liparis tanakae TaxID=230148 RepID=A0A4Z2F121_9TELE|nr:hypothetical protein EYF80_055105 [Liparis tanakae]
MALACHVVYRQPSSPEGDPKATCSHTDLALVHWPCEGNMQYDHQQTSGATGVHTNACCVRTASYLGDQ